MKLIMVGMRFQSTVVVKDAIAEYEKTGKEIRLTLVKNNNGVQYIGAVYGVAVCDIAGNIVGYIRNEDLPNLLNTYKPVHNQVYFAKATVEICYQNYWRLELNENKYVPGTYKVNNSPCNEVSLPSATFIQEFNASIPDKEKYYGVTIDNTNKTISLIKDTNMNTNNIRNQLFREVDFVTLDIQSGQFGIKSQEGITIYKDGGVSVTPFADLGISVPAFAMRIEVADLKAGDIVVNGTDSAFFKEAVEGGGYTVVTVTGETKTIAPVANLFFGKNTVLAVKNMFGGMADKDGKKGMDPMMLMLMLGDTKKVAGSSGGMDTKTLMLMSMMGGGKGMDSNMLMMMALLGK